MIAHHRQRETRAVRHAVQVPRVVAERRAEVDEVGGALGARVRGEIDAVRDEAIVAGLAVRRRDAGRRRLIRSATRRRRCDARRRARGSRAMGSACASPRCSTRMMSRSSAAQSASSSAYQSALNVLAPGPPAVGTTSGSAAGSSDRLAMIVDRQLERLLGIGAGRAALGHDQHPARHARRVLGRHLDRTPRIFQGGADHDGRSDRRRGTGGPRRTAERSGDGDRREKQGRNRQHALTGQRSDVAPADTPPCPASGSPERIPQRIAGPGHSVTLVSIPSHGQEDEACGADPPRAAPL